jgi:hypothetical protein
MPITGDQLTEQTAKSMLDMYDFIAHVTATGVFKLTEPKIDTNPSPCIQVDRSRQDAKTAEGKIRISFNNCELNASPAVGANERASRKSAWLPKVRLNGTMDVDIDKTFAADDTTVIKKVLDVNFSGLNWNAYNNPIPAFINCEDHRNTLLAKFSNEQDRATFSLLLDQAEQARLSQNSTQGNQFQAFIDVLAQRQDTPGKQAYELLSVFKRNLYQEDYRFDGKIIISLTEKIITTANLTAFNNVNGTTSQLKNFTYKWNYGMAPGANPGDGASGQLTMNGNQHLSISSDPNFFSTMLFRLNGAENSGISISSTKNLDAPGYTLGVNVLKTNDKGEYIDKYLRIAETRLGDNHSANHCQPVVLTSIPDALYDKNHILKLRDFGTWDPDHNFISFAWAWPLVPEAANANPEAPFLNNHLPVSAPWNYNTALPFTGNYEVQLTVRDPNPSHTVIRTFPLRVKMDAPQFTLSGPNFIQSGDSVAIDIDVTPGYEGTLNYELLAGPDGAVLTQDGELSWNASLPFFGGQSTVNFVIGVSNEDRLSVQTLSFQVDSNGTYTPTIIPKMSVTPEFTKTTGHGIARADLNKDGKAELLLANGAKMIKAFELSEDTTSGKQQFTRKWSNTYDFTANKVESVLSVRELRRKDNGETELAVLTNQRLLVIAPNKATPLAEVQVRVNTKPADPYKTLNRFATADLDGDGNDEIILIHINIAAEQFLSVYAHDLSELAVFENSAFNALAIGNVDNDNALEIVTQSGLVLDGMPPYGSSSIEWNYSGGFGPNLALVDTNGDGIKDIASLNGSVMTRYSAVNRTGLPPFTLNTTVTKGDSYEFFDINGDQIDEFVWGSATTSAAAVAELNGNTYSALATQADNLGTKIVSVTASNDHLATIGLNANNHIITTALPFSGTINWSSSDDSILTGICRPTPDNYADRSFANCQIKATDDFVGDSVVEINADGSDYRINTDVNLADSFAAVFNPEPGNIFQDPRIFTSAHRIGTLDLAIIGADLVLTITEQSFKLNDFNNSLPLFESVAPGFIIPSIGETRRVAVGDINGDGNINMVGINFTYNVICLAASPPQLCVEIYLDVFDQSKRLARKLLASAKNNGPNMDAVAAVMRIGSADLIVEDLDNDGKGEILYLQGSSTRSLQIWSLDGRRLLMKNEAIFNEQPGKVIVSDIDGDGSKEVIVSYHRGNDIFDAQTDIRIYDAQLNKLKDIYLEGWPTALSSQKLDNGRTQLLVGVEKGIYGQEKYYATGIDAQSGYMAWQSAPLSAGAIRQMQLSTADDGRQYLHVTTDSAIYVSQ